MTTGVIGDAQRKAAKVAGLVYPLSFVTVVSVTYGIVRPLVAGVDPAQAARNILMHETPFRVGIVGNLLYCIEVVILSAAIYVVLEPVAPLLALLAALGRLVQGFIWLLICVNLFTALRLLTQPEYARALPPDQLSVLARLHLSGFDQYYVSLLFWCLGSMVGACAWLQSRYIPRALAAFGILSSAWGAACTLCLFLFPGFQKVVDLTWFDVPMVLFELVLGPLLLFRGLGAPAGADN